MPLWKHGSQCLRAIISLGEAWLDTERAELVGVGSRGRKNRKDGASPSVLRLRWRPYATFQGPVWSWSGSPGSSSPRAHWGIHSLGWDRLQTLPFQVESLVLAAKGARAGQVAWCTNVLISNFSIELLLLSLHVWCFTIKWRSTGFQVKLTWVSILASPSIC